VRPSSSRWASSAELGKLHLNSDWAILESVDARYRPVPAGQAGATTLLTNLANHVQPIVRYELGDRVTLHPGRCACGLSLPVIEVQGRTDDSLPLTDDRGRRQRLSPLALTTVLEDDAGLFEFQLVQTGPRALRLSLPPENVHGLERGCAALRGYLEAQGLSRVERAGAARQRRAARAQRQGAAGRRRRGGQGEGPMSRRAWRRSSSHAA
jgi:phenylacetate-coenzyme A ligase PaaK-like adenylate-forming protein